VRQAVKLTNAESVRVADTIRRAIEHGQFIRTEDLPALFPADDDRLRAWASRTNVLRFCRSADLDIGRILPIMPPHAPCAASDTDRALARIESRLDALLNQLGIHCDGGRP
jgi:hypothetical protein